MADLSIPLSTTNSTQLQQAETTSGLDNENARELEKAENQGNEYDEEEEVDLEAIQAQIEATIALTYETVSAALGYNTSTFGGGTSSDDQFGFMHELNFRPPRFVSSYPFVHFVLLVGNLDINDLSQYLATSLFVTSPDPRFVSTRF